MALPVNSLGAPFLLSSDCQVTTAVPQTGQMQPFYQAFLKGEPKALGTVQIVLGILQIALSAVLIATMTEYISATIVSGVTFWGTIFYIIAGSLSVGAENKPSRCLVRGSLALNIISCVASVIELILIMMDFIFFNSFGYCSHNYCYSFLSVRMVSLAFLLIVSLLQFSVSTTLSVFGCRSLKHKSPGSHQPVFLINNHYNIIMTPGVVTPETLNTSVIPVPMYNHATSILNAPNNIK